MVKEPEILFGNVMHARLFPKKNRFNYGIYYLSVPLSKRKNLPIAYNRPGILSLYDKDHGPCDGSDIETWARSILADYNLDKADGDITLICMPRVLGYVFNPVSFWLCHDKRGDVLAILCEVHNTFGEQHTYLCAHENQQPLAKDITLKGKKVFHVSPFLEREGHYTFRFNIAENAFGVWIDYFDKHGHKQLVTSLAGNMMPMTRDTVRRAFWRHPLVTLKAIGLIHWQALKLVSKGIRYISKPRQQSERISATDNIKKK